MRSQVLGAEKALMSGDYDVFGEILREGWRLKKSLASGITNSAIDEMYDKACREGALGGKICGAGGGGFLLLYVPLAQQEKVREAMASYREMPFRFEKDGSKVIFNINERSWKN